MHMSTAFGFAPPTGIRRSGDERCTVAVDFLRDGAEV